MATHTLQSMKLAILEVLAHHSRGKEHKINLLGRPYQRGALERHLDTTFSPEDRVLADRAFEQLKADLLIRPTYQDLVSPELWVEVTDAGRQALKRGVLDDLDLALQKINPHLIEIRAGAWAAIASGLPDSIRQAAHSGRELIDQVLKEGAPEEKVKQQPDFVSDPSSRSGVTRRHRLKFLMRTYRGVDSDSELRVAERACDVVLAVDDRLTSLAHTRETPLAQDVIDSLQSAEIALRRILPRAEPVLQSGSARPQHDT